MKTHGKRRNVSGPLSCRLFGSASGKIRVSIANMRSLFLCCAFKTRPGKQSGLRLALTLGISTHPQSSMRAAQNLVISAPSCRGAAMLSVDHSLARSTNPLVGWHLAEARPPGRCRTHTVAIRQSRRFVSSTNRMQHNCLCPKAIFGSGTHLGSRQHDQAPHVCQTAQLAARLRIRTLYRSFPGRRLETSCVTGSAAFIRQRQPLATIAAHEINLSMPDGCLASRHSVRASHSLYISILRTHDFSSA